MGVLFAEEEIGLHLNGIGSMLLDKKMFLSPPSQIWQTYGLALGALGGEEIAT